MAAAGIWTGRAQAADPAMTLIGQRAETCKSGHPFVVEVVSAELAGSVQGAAADGGATWLVVILTATNTGAEPGDLYFALAVRGEQGQMFPFRSPGSREEIDLAAAYGVQELFTKLDGGASDRLLATFQVPIGATGFTLVGDPIHCS